MCPFWWAFDAPKHFARRLVAPFSIPSILLLYSAALLIPFPSFALRYHENYDDDMLEQGKMLLKKEKRKRGIRVDQPLL